MSVTDSFIWVHLGFQTLNNDFWKRPLEIVGHTVHQRVKEIKRISDFKKKSNSILILYIYLSLYKNG